MSDAAKAVSATLPMQMSKLLDLHLSRSIARFGEGTMSGKIKELAARMRETRKQWDAEAEALLEHHSQIEARGRAAFSGHHAQLSELRKGFEEMEDAIHELEGSNSSGNEEGSGLSGTSFQGGERG